ncbi:MAG: SHOCT domain-containing protein [Bryobacterales bacterium]|nr:SHOCT domain-containing protein [Bryobacterales bacterium]
MARTVARTALIAGTAQTVAGGVAARQQADIAKKAAAKGAAPAPGMLTDEVVDQLKKLADLRDAGVLTEKEFAAKKAKLLP